MTGLLTGLATIATIMLLVSAAHTGSRATASDSYSRGSWEIARWTSSRNRPLDAHELRWQTSLLSGKHNESRWRDVVAELAELEKKAAGVDPGDAPDAYNSRWVDDRITQLEAAIAAKTEQLPDSSSQKQ